MINFISKKTFESTTAPGVTFTLRRLGKMHRAKRDLSILHELAEYRTACQRAVKLLHSAGYTIAEDGTYTRASAEPIAPEVEAEIASLDDTIMTLLRAHIMPAAIKASLLLLEGVSGDDGPITTAEALLSAGPQVDALIEEVYHCSEKANEVTAEEKLRVVPVAA